MKLLIAFALFAVAFADEIRVVPLPPPVYSSPSMGQLIIPNYIMDAIKAGVNVLRNEVVADQEGLKVHFVDTPLEGAASEINPSETVQVVDTPLAALEPVELGIAPLPALETAPSAEESVRIAEPSLPEIAPVAEEIVPEPVLIAEAPLPALETSENAPDAVRFVDDAPLDVVPFAVAHVRIAEPILPEIAPGAEEIVPEPVLIAEAPLPALETAENAPDAVRFVDDAPLDVVPIAVASLSIAEPSLPEVAPVAEEIVPVPVQIAEAPLPAFKTVEAIKIALRQFFDYRSKQFNDPRLR